MVEYFAIELNESVRGVGFLAVLNCIHYMLVNFAGGSMRKKAFTNDVMSQFNEEHRLAFGTDPPKGGYPDCGSGRYSEKLPFDHWWAFNID